MVSLIATLNERKRDNGCREPPRPGRSTARSQDRNGASWRKGERRWAAMVEAWEIRGWSLKVQEEPLSTGSSQNESCYLILLSTLLRFIRQLFDALQYATNRARIVCRRRSLFSALDIPSCRHSPSLPRSLPLSLWHIYIRQHAHAYLYFRVYAILQSFSRSVTFSNFLLATFL